MRLKTTAAAAILSLGGSFSGAMACDLSADNCLRSTVVWPLYTLNGRPLGAVEALVRRPPRLQISRDTGQPLAVIYDNPDSRPGSVEPYLHLEPLRHVGRSDTVGAYPVGY